MRINPDTCLDCGDCIPYCPVGAITSTGEGYGAIDLDECVECSVCLRNAPCPSDSIEATELVWPRSIRAFFSDPMTEHKETRIPGRGTEEMKTNEVTGRYRHGEVGIACEVGRPGIGTRLREVEKITIALAELGIEFEPQNPLTKLLVEPHKGLLNPEVLDEKVLSAIVEFKAPLEMTPTILERLRAVEGQVDTVFSVNLVCKVAPDGTVPVAPMMQSLGIPLSFNGKSNMGLGRPYFEEVIR